METSRFKGRWRGRSNRRPIVRGKGAITEALWGKHWGMQQDLDNNRAPISFVPDRPECQSKLKPHTFLGFYTPPTNSLGHSAFWWDFSVTFTGELHLTSSKLLTCLTAQCFTTLRITFCWWLTAKWKQSSSSGRPHFNIGSTPTRKVTWQHWEIFCSGLPTIMAIFCFSAWFELKKKQLHSFTCQSIYLFYFHNIVSLVNFVHFP